jgi:hypothetical protein
VVKEAGMEAAAKKRGNGKGRQKQADFEGKVYRVGVDAHKSGYAAAITTSVNASKSRNIHAGAS